MMQTRDSSATHSSSNGRELKFTPASDKLFGHGERHSLTSWRLDETYSRLPRYKGPGATIFFVDQLKRLKISILLGRSKTLRQNAAIAHFETRPCH